MDLQKIIDTYCFSSCKEPFESCTQCKLRSFENYFKKIKEEGKTVRTKKNKNNSHVQQTKTQIVVKSGNIKETSIKLLPQSIEKKVIIVNEPVSITVK